MTSKQLYSNISHLETSLRQNKYLLGVIRMLTNRHDDITSFYIHILNSDNNHLVNITEGTRNKLRDLIQEVRKLKHRQIFAEIAAISKSIETIEFSFNAQTTEKLNLVKDQIEKFSAAYEALISSHHIGDLARLLTIAERLDSALVSSIEFASITIKNLCPEVPLEASETAFEIYLGAKTDFFLFLEKTSALEKIYEELCHLFNISSKQEPLKVVKIESGSLWVWLNGNAKVVNTIDSIIKKATSYIYRNYTDEGKLSSIPKKVETIESVLGLSEELKKHGIPTEQLDDHLKKAANAIGNELEKLLVGEKEIELNGKVISIIPEKKQNLILIPTTSLLSEKSVKMIEEKKTEE